MPQTDIIIKLGGSTAKMITAKATALDRLAMSVGKVKAAFTGGPFQKATQGMKGFNNEVRKATTGARQYGKQVENAGQRTDRFGTKVSGAGNVLDRFRMLFMRMVRIMTAFLIISTITRAVREFTTTLAKAPMQMELWNKQLVVLSGNATLAAERLELLKIVAIETPLELPDLFQGLTTLQAFNVEISERTIPLMTDLAAVSGRTFQEVSEVIGKVIAGSPTAITRSLPTLAINPMEFKALAAELGSRSEALFQMIQEKFEGFAKESATTVIGVISNIKDAYFVIMADLGEALMVPLRETSQAIMDWLMLLRESPERLRELQDKVMLIGDELVQMTKSVWSAFVAVNKFTQAIGGLNVAVGTLLGFLVGRALAAKFIALAAAAKTAEVGLLAMVLRSMNPWIIAAGLVMALAGLLYVRWQNQRDALRLVTMRQSEFADELARTNRLMDRSIGLVDAQTRANQALTITSMAMGLIEGAGDPEQLKARMTGARAVVPHLPSSVAAEARELVMRLDVVGSRLAELEKIKGTRSGRAAFDFFYGEEFDNLVRRRGQLVGELAGKFQEASGIMAKEAEEIRKAMEAPTTSTGDKVVGGDETDPLAEYLKFWRDNFKPMIAEFDVLKAKFDMGLISRSAAREQASAMKEMVERWREGFLLMDSPVMQQIGLMLSPVVSNMQSFMDGIDSELTGEFAERFTELKLKIELGMEPGAATTALTALRDELIEMMRTLEDSLTPEMKKAFEGILRGINGAIESLKPEDMSQALEQVMRMVIKQGADAISDALASMISPELGISLGQAMGQLFSAMLNVMGDAMIQMGIAAKVIQELFKDVTNPATAVALIAGGILLKTFAKAIGGRMKSAAQGGGGGSGGGGGAINYPQFSPGAYGDKRSWYVTINAMDAASFEQTIARNPVAFGRQIAVIAREDRATGGQAYGAFQPA